MGSGGGGGGSGGSGGVRLHGNGADHVFHCVDLAIFNYLRGWGCLEHGVLGTDGRDGHCERSKKKTGSSLTITEVEASLAGSV